MTTLLLLVRTSGAQQPGAATASGSSRPLPLNGDVKADGATGVLKGRVLMQDGNRPPANLTVVVQTAGRAGYPVLVATDEDGTFQVNNLRAAAYVLTAVAPGYVNAPDRPYGQAVYYRVGEFATLRMVKGGVITGRVMNASGEPLAAAQVRAIRVKDAAGQPARDSAPTRAARTDDRGVYRLYGLESGSYFVAAAGNSPAPAGGERASVFYPSAGLANASPVQVMAGQESGGIDILFREERGYTISGSVAGAPGLGTSRERGMAGGVVTLTHAATGVPVASAPLTLQDGGREFTLGGVPDGDYEITARSGALAASVARRISVRGADVHGVALTLTPLGSIAGRLLLEAAPQAGAARCLDDRRALLEETVIAAEAYGAQSGRAGAAQPAGATPDGEGRFVLSNLSAGEYFVETRLPSRDWYVRSATLPGANAAAPSRLSVSPGASIEGLTLSVAAGAASLRGRVLSGVEGAPLPAGLRVHLVPSETERAEDWLRYAEAPVGPGGEFAFDNLAPGRYLAAVLADPETTSVAPSTRAAADGGARARLRREAQLTNTPVELQPCREAADLVLRYVPRGSGSPRSSRGER